MRAAGLEQLPTGEFTRSIVRDLFSLEIPAEVAVRAVLWVIVGGYEFGL